MSFVKAVDGLCEVYGLIVIDERLDLQILSSLIAPKSLVLLTLLSVNTDKEVLIPQTHILQEEKWIFLCVRQE